MSIVTMDATNKRVAQAITGATLSTIIFNVSSWMVGSPHPFWTWVLEFFVLLAIRAIPSKVGKLIFIAVAVLVTFVISN